jgi:hypothetical protein
MDISDLVADDKYALYRSFDQEAMVGLMKKLRRAALAIALVEEEVALRDRNAIAAHERREASLSLIAPLSVTSSSLAALPHAMSSLVANNATTALSSLSPSLTASNTSAATPSVISVPSVANIVQPAQRASSAVTSSSSVPVRSLPSMTMLSQPLAAPSPTSRLTNSYDWNGHITTPSVTSTAPKTTITTSTDEATVTAPTSRLPSSVMSSSSFSYTRPPVAGAVPSSSSVATAAPQQPFQFGVPNDVTTHAAAATKKASNINAIAAAAAAAAPVVRAAGARKPVHASRKSREVVLS